MYFSYLHSESFVNNLVFVLKKFVCNYCYRKAKINLLIFILVPTAIVSLIVIVIVIVRCYRRKQSEKKDAMVEQLCNVS